jgi:hypothetical protein
VDIALQATNKTYKEVKMCELGNQHCNVPNEPLIGKQLMLKRGVAEHVTLDINGEDGAERFDMEKPILKWAHYFDILTNYGSTEHMPDQYEVFKNIHNLVKTGGAVVHVVPPVGEWPDHCPVYYVPKFFEQLSTAAGYKIVYCEQRDNGDLKRRPLLCCVYSCPEHQPFISKEEFSKFPLHYVNFQNKQVIDSLQQFKLSAINKDE